MKASEYAHEIWHGAVGRETLGDTGVTKNKLECFEGSNKTATATEAKGRKSTVKRKKILTHLLTKGLHNVFAYMPLGGGWAQEQRTEAPQSGTTVTGTTSDHGWRRLSNLSPALHRPMSSWACICFTAKYVTTKYIDSSS